MENDASPSSQRKRDITALDAYLAETGESDDAPFPYRALESRYRLEGEPRQGGMSELWRATDLVSGEIVAIKRLRAHRIGNDRARRRFHREALSMAALTHENVLRLLDLGRDENGDYLVFEWAAKGSLSDRVRLDGALPEPEVFSIATRIGDALAAAHARGHVHRDVKPHNILVMEAGEPKLADFGLVLLEGESELHVPGARPGTPNYMAPEQVTSGSTVDARADVYAFGKTLYYLLTGERPLAADLSRVPWAWRGPLASALEVDPKKRTPSVRDLMWAVRRRRIVRSTPFRIAAIGSIGSIAALLVVSLLARRDSTANAPGAPEPDAPGRIEHRANDETAAAVAETPPRTDTPAPQPAVQTDRIDWFSATAIAADPARSPYGGIELKAQDGLVPLRQDLVSRLLEFLVLGTGAPPERNANGRLVIAADTGIVLVLVPSSDSPYFISKYELTQGQYSRLTRAEPSRLSPRATAPGLHVDLTHPVENLSSGEARAALRSVGLRLPTEGEWDVSFRAGGEEIEILRRAPWNENLGDIADIEARIERGAPPPPRLGDGFYGHAPVGSFDANDFGIYDLPGNVSEWCEPSSTDRGTIAFGGNFASPPEATSFTLRVECESERRSVTIGVRAARDLER